MKKYMLLPVLFLTLCFGCEDRDDNLSAVNLRIKNTSEVSFSTVQVGAADKIHTDVASGEYSDYLEYETAYKYAYISLVAQDTTYTLQPVDFVGETPLPLGFYTYELDITEDKRIDLKFIVD